ncbi:MAG: S8/S53 family peptidase [Bacteroidales bacterium]|nr:S8/S53 family peptidase [Bacteroidales bacterium]
MKQIRNLIAVSFILFALSCTEKQEKETGLTFNQPTSSQTAINNWITNSIKTTGDVNWQDASDELLWSAISHGNNILTIGYGNSYNGTLKSTLNDEVKESIIKVVTNKVNTLGLKNAQSPIVYEDEKLTIMDVMVTNIHTIGELRQIDNIRYMEPSGYNYEVANESLKSALSSGSGCGTQPSPIHPNDVTTVAPGAWVSWTFTQHNIDKAWEHSKGEGITVGLIDTGVSEDQELMGAEFSNEYSPNRYIEKIGVYVNSYFPWSTETDGEYDLCGHGTSMGSLIAAPMNDKNMPVGVANRCNLIAYRACYNVVLDSYHERVGVATALTELADNEEVKIISMSLGYAYSISRVADAIRYAHDKGKLIFAAGGTSTSYTNWYGVIFPASMDETVAVTGIQDNGYNVCDICHEGDKIDFALVIQHNYDTERNAVTLGLENNDIVYMSGSSSATATTAGIAALVWARHPGWDKNQVLNKLKESAEFYPNRDDNFGYGCIDALQAVQ